MTYKLHDLISRALMKSSRIMCKSSISVCKYFNSIQKRRINDKLNNCYLKAQYKTNHSNISYDKDFNKVIWIFWWQGYRSMPLIVKKCINSIIHNSGDFKVILITKNNFKKYTDIPKYIINALQSDKLGLTPFSDILRFNLLMNNGGLWLDSTNYCTSTLHSKDFDCIDPFTTIGSNNKYNYFVSAKWTVHLMGGHRNNPLFIFMTNFFNLYWKYNSKLLSNDLVDFALGYAYVHNIGGFKTSIDSIYAYNNLNKYKLFDVMNKKYNRNVYLRLVSNTQLFKLTYKCKYNNHGDTFYHRVLNNQL